MDVFKAIPCGCCFCWCGQQQKKEEKCIDDAWMKPAGRSLADLYEKRRRSCRSSRCSSLNSIPSLNDTDELKSQITPNGSIKYFHPKKKPFCEQFCLLLQCIYKKSRIHGAFPILILIAYSLLGGIIFYLIECPHEKLILQQKKVYFEREKRSMHRLILNIEKVVHQIRSNFSTNRYALSKNLQAYKRFAINQIDKSVYWYVLNMYHLSDQEIFKTKLLQPAHPENRWLIHFESSFGQMYALRNYTEQLSLRYWEIALEQNDNAAVVRRKMDAALIHFGNLTGLSNLFTPAWTFWNAMFLAVTTYTTIGYGNITAHSNLGKLATMLYAAIGIPLVLMILHKLGRQSLRVLEQFWDQFLNLMEYISCLRSGVPIKKRIRDVYDSNVPLALPVGIAIGWVFLCAAVFLKFENNWDYFKSFYFFFCSLTTIGYGDVTPTNSEDIFLIFGLIMVGLALVSMCINVVQLKLEKLFEEFLVTMLEEYKQKGVPAEGMKVPSKINMLAIWRMWRRRRRQRTVKRKNTISSNVFLQIRRGRQALFEQMHRALFMVNSSTQTEGGIIGAYMGMGEELNERVSWSEVSVLPPAVNPVHRISARKVENIDHQVLIVSSPASQQLCMASVVNSSNGLHNALVMESPAVEHGKEIESPLTQLSSKMIDDASSSNQLTPNMIDDDQVAKRWTFVGTGKNSPGAPRGLMAPYMYRGPKFGREYINKMRRLLIGMGARIQDCHMLASNSDSAITAQNQL